MDWSQIPITLGMAGAFLGTVGFGLLAVVAYAVKPVRWMESVNKDLEMLKDFAKEFPKETNRNFAEVREDIKKLLARDRLSERSPLCLEEPGERISARIDAEDWAPQLADAVQDAVAGMKPPGIQDYCFNHMFRDLETTAEQEEKIAAAVYENGTHREGVLGVLAIVLRDILLERNGHPVPKSKGKSDSESE